MTDTRTAAVRADAGRRAAPPRRLPSVVMMTTAGLVLAGLAGAPSADDQASASAAAPLPLPLPKPAGKSDPKPVTPSKSDVPAGKAGKTDPKALPGKGEPRPEPKADPPVVPETGLPADPDDRLKELGWRTDDAMREGLVVPRARALSLHESLTVLEKDRPVGTLSALQQSRWWKSVAHLRLSLGRPAAAIEAADKWAAADPKDVNAAATRYEAALATGDRTAAAKALREWFRVGKFIFTIPGETPPNLKGLADAEFDRLYATPSQEKARDRYLDGQAKIWAPMGKSLKAVRFVEPVTGKKKFEWTPEQGRVLVLVLWNSNTPAAAILFAAVRDVQKVFPDDDRIVYASLNLLEKPADKAKEAEADAKVEFTGARHQENLTGPPSLFTRDLGSPPFPLLLVIGPDGKVRYTTGPARIATPVARQTAVAIVAALGGETK